jgi:hypothetical protein
MAHNRPTYPTVFLDTVSNLWKAEMKDKKTGRIWGTGVGETRDIAIINARHNQPKDSRIKRLIGWTIRHPFLGSMAVGTVLAFHQARKKDNNIPVSTCLAAGALFGVAMWGTIKFLKWIFGKPKIEEFMGEGGD